MEHVSVTDNSLDQDNNAIDPWISGSLLSMGGRGFDANRAGSSKQNKCVLYIMDDGQAVRCLSKLLNLLPENKDYIGRLMIKTDRNANSTNYYRGLWELRTML